MQFLIIPSKKLNKAMFNRHEMILLKDNLLFFKKMFNLID